MKCWHCPDCGYEVLTVTKGYVPVCCDEKMIEGGMPKAAKSTLNPIKASKRSTK
jgi:hypothetical protein